ncbi:exodeoxyribonuclease III [Abyssibacter profundi]|uniref:Exodeoxyribonuclease III n=1 Tax=Abyssibacter profundi TaxID=2182787 RepID=A0A383XPL4_9GAMM|nr:exodeoxyribonuclease III [Abyssibacter profundi]PWN54568.1 exodeoxyribonuclease III [Abyssibacter profundi]
MTNTTTRLATWNVNSLNVRLPHMLQWLNSDAADLVAVQETKLTDDRFPVDALTEAGWHSAWHGQKTYNGVALISRSPIEDVTTGIPGFDDTQARVIAGSVGELRMICVYVPNGQAVGSDKYSYKLEWLAALRRYIADSLREHPRLVVSGDFNIAPTVDDTHDPDRWEGNILCSDAERAALAALLDTGLTDAFTCVEPPEQRFTWWDYRQGGFRRGHGLRIDHHLISAPLVEAFGDFRIDIEPRRWERPSDHTPVICELRGN